MSNPTSKLMTEESKPLINGTPGEYQSTAEMDHDCAFVCTVCLESVRNRDPVVILYLTLCN